MKKAAGWSDGLLYYLLKYEKGDAISSIQDENKKRNNMEM